MTKSRIVAALGGAAVMAAGWGSGAAAFGGNYEMPSMAIGSCMAGSVLDDTVGTAIVFMSLGANYYTAGGSGLYSNTFYSDDPAVSVAALQSCNLSNITNLRQTGAGPAGGFAFGNYTGFSFTATDLADGLTYDWEYALSGQNSTILIATKRLHVVPSVGGPTSEKVVANLQASRSTALLQNQPDLIGLLDASQPSVTMDGTDLVGAMTTGMAYGPVWGRLSASWSNEGGADSRYVLGSFGAQTRLNENAVAGVMLQFDKIKLTDTPSVAEGKGWLAGPYMVARLPDHEITFEGRALWGKTSNDISPLGTYTDSVDGTRSLVMAKVSTKVDAGPVVLRPRLSVAQVHESTDAYTDGGGAAVPKVTTTLDQVLAGVEVQKTVTTAQGTLTLLGALDGVWSHTDSSVNGSAEGTRGRLSLGLNYDLGTNGALTFTGFYDGLGKSDFNARGLAASYVLRF